MLSLKPKFEATERYLINIFDEYRDEWHHLRNSHDSFSLPKHLSAFIDDTRESRDRAASTIKAFQDNFAALKRTLSEVATE